MQSSFDRILGDLFEGFSNYSHSSVVYVRNGIQLPEEPDPQKVSEFERKYREILETARKEYEDVPTNNYYRDGYNFYLRMKIMHEHACYYALGRTNKYI